MSVQAPAEKAPRLSEGAALALRGFGLTIMMLGIMGTMVGGILSGLCLIENGIICSGTMIGSMGGVALMGGLPALILGIAMLVAAGKWGPSRAQARVARIKAMQASALEAGGPPFASLENPQGERRPSDCPSCGGPIEPTANQCPWCGQIFQ